MPGLKAIRDQGSTQREMCSSSFALVLIGCCLLAGCQRTALRPDDRRSQFDRYDQSRNQRAQPYLEDEFGQRTPNLAGRLIDPED